MSRQCLRKWVTVSLCLLFLASAALAAALMCVHAQCHCVREPDCLVCIQIVETFSLAKRLSPAAGIAALALLALRSTRMPSTAFAGSCSPTPIALKTRMND